MSVCLSFSNFLRISILLKFTYFMTHDKFIFMKVSICTWKGNTFLYFFFSCYKHVCFFSFIYISWRLITLQYCIGFCHTLTWISHEFTCVPNPEPPSHLSPHPIPLGLPRASALSTCLMHPTWTGDLFHTW